MIEGSNFCLYRLPAIKRLFVSQRGDIDTGSASTSERQTLKFVYSGYLTLFLVIPLNESHVSLFCCGE